MIEIPASITVPLRTDADGVIRVGKTRVTLITIIGGYKMGETAEQLHEGFPTVPLADIHAVISYYLQHREEVDQYIREEEEVGERLRQQIMAERPEMFRAQEKFRELINKQREQD